MLRKLDAVAAAYELAPHCAPLTPPLPASTAPTSSQHDVPPSEADDGTDLSACADGTCEVVITGAAGPFTITVTVAGGKVHTEERFPGGGSGRTSFGGVGGEGRITVGDDELTMTVVGLQADTAVIEFALS